MGGRRNGVLILTCKEGVADGEIEEEVGCDSIWRSAFQTYFPFELDGPTTGSPFLEGSGELEPIELEALKVKGKVGPSLPLIEVEG